MMGLPITAVVNEMRRLRVLQYLMDMPTYEAAAGILRLHCATIGVPTTSDQMVTCIAWLQEVDLISVRMHGKEPIAKLTPDGREVADGTRILPGVLRPDP